MTWNLDSTSAEPLQEGIRQTLDTLSQYPDWPSKTSDEERFPTTKTWKKDPLPDLLLDTYEANQMVKQTRKIGQWIAEEEALRWVNLPFLYESNVPTLFYDQHPDLHQLAAQCQCPLTYVENGEVIGIAAINPLIANALGKYIQKTLSELKNFTPIIHLIQLDYDGWLEMNQKHFKA